MSNSMFVKTPDGIVVREILPNGERAWRLNNDKTWAVCYGHKGPWVSTDDKGIPLWVLLGANLEAAS